MHTFRTIAVYFNKEGVLIGVPSTVDEQRNLVLSIDNIIQLEPPYDTAQLENFLEETLSLCYSRNPPEKLTPSVLQKYRGARSYRSSVEGLGMVDIRWVIHEGYYVSPSWKNETAKYAYHYMMDKTVLVPDSYDKGKLAEAFLAAMKLSPIDALRKAP